MDEFFLTTRHRPTGSETLPEGVSRYRLTVEYDGTEYCGWQRQKNGMSVQETLENAWQTLMHEHVGVVGSSRTDAGVHARGLTAHFDSARHIAPEKIPLAMNSVLPEDVRVRACSVTDGTFHARFSACGKVYRYHFYNSHAMCAIGRQYASLVPLPMDTGIMQEELSSLLGKHDFAAFAASGSVVRDTTREMYAGEVSRNGSHVWITVMGNGFLYNMVRILAGTLQEVGTGKREPGAISRAIVSGNRLDLGQTAPAKGLVLEAVLYAGDEALGKSYFTEHASWESQCSR